MGIVESRQLFGARATESTTKRYSVLWASCLKSCIRSKKYKSFKGNVGKIAPNVLKRKFEASRPNQKWVTDVTEFNVGGQKLYLSPVLDLYNGEIIAYEMARRPLFDMVNTMLNKAFAKLGVDLHGILNESPRVFRRLQL
jgi:transposase InsO family protein